MINIQDLSWSIDSKVMFDKLNLDIAKGEKILLTAPSGSGKTSLFKFMLGFRPIEAGMISINNMELNRKNLAEIRGNIAYVSQDIDLPNYKIHKIFEEIFSYKANREIKYRDMLDFYLKDFHLNEDILNKKLEDISGGERQRLGFIICLLLNRDIWLLDEVTSSLDKEMKLKVQDYILDSSKTILIISHDKHWDLERFREVTW